MATLHTNYVSGNDTTGDGTTALPYKTINKALSVAIDGDLIKVAGGELVQIPGATVTVTARGTTLTPNMDLTTHFTLGDSIFVDTSASDPYPIAANGMVVSSIFTNSITVATETPVQFTPGTYNVYKLSTYHYSVASGALETFTSFTASNVTIEGGWDATFTTQIGWTGVKTAGATATANFTTTWSQIKPNVIWNKFLFSNVNNAFGGSNAAIGINTMVFNRVSAPFGTSNFGVHAPSAIGFTTLYAYGSSMNGSWNGSANSPVTLNLKQWTTATSTTGLRGTLKVGYGLTYGSANPSIKSLQANWRSLNTVLSQLAPFTGSPIDIGDIYIDELNMYIGGTMYHPIMAQAGNAGSWRWIGDLNVSIIDGTRSGIYAFTGGTNSDSLSFTSEGPLNINRITGTLEQLPWKVYGTATATNTIINNQRALIYGKDTEGQKVVNMDNIVKYADATQYVTGQNSLRYKLTTNTTGSDTIRYFAAILNKPTATTSLTFTIKVKASKAITIGNPELIYGPAYSKFVAATPSTTSVTTGWQDITFTVNPSTIADWNIADDGLMQVVIPISSSVVDNTEVAYLWVDSVSVI
jgi:hypothetical protein